jgi:prepilin-type N-terminal cleavage/methylation domain-containing protein
VFPRLRAQPAATRCGFTLLELLVVMIIICIAFFALRPNFTGMIRGAQERTALRQLVSLFAAARAEAVAKGKLTRVIYDSFTGAFHAEIQPDPEADRQLFDPLRLMGKSELRLPEHLTIDAIKIGGLTMSPADTQTIYFYPDGRTDGAAFLLVKDSGDTAVIEILSATGAVKLDV